MTPSKTAFKPSKVKDGPTPARGGDRGAAAARLCPVCGKNHHGLCHKCPHDADAKAGKYLDREWSKVPCSACQICAEISHHGASHVSIEAADFDRPVEVEHEKASQIADFLREFIGLSRREQIVVYCRFAHRAGLEKWPLRRVAQRFNISTQAVFSIQERVCKRIPAIGAMFGDN